MRSTRLLPLPYSQIHAQGTNTSIVMFVSHPVLISPGLNSLVSDPLDANLGHARTSAADRTTSTAESLESEEQRGNVADEQEPQEHVARLNLATLLLVVSRAKGDVIAAFTALSREVSVNAE